MYYERDLIDDICARNDIVDVISSYVGLKKAGSSYKCCCPFHEEKTPSFVVSKEKQFFHCFGCGVGGNVITFVMKYENFTFPEAVKLLAERAGVSLPETELSQEEKRAISRKQQLYDMYKSAAAYYAYILNKTEAGRPGLEYYHGRGFTQDTIYRFGLGFADINRDDLYRYLRSKGYRDDLIRDSHLVYFSEKQGPRDLFWNRVMTPIADINGRVIAFGGRVLGDGTPKYINSNESEIFSKSRNLFAMNYARRSKRKGLILCEGYMDVISQHQAGYDNAVASLGTAFTEGQAALIKRYCDEVYLAYDNDGAGRKATLKAIEILRSKGISQRIISLAPYKDPDEFIKNLGSEEYDKRIETAMPGRLYEIQVIHDGYNMSDPEHKTRFMNETAMLLAGIEDSVERQNYIDTVATQYVLDRESLARLVTKHGMAGLRSVSLQSQGNGSYSVERTDTVQADTRRPVDAVVEKHEIGDEGMLVSFIADNPSLFDKLKGYIDLEDFEDAEVREIAAAMYKEYKEKGTVSPSAIISGYEEVAMQERVSRMFSVSSEQGLTPDELETAINELVKRIMLANIDRKLRDVSTTNRMELIKKRNSINSIYIRL